MSITQTALERSPPCGISVLISGAGVGGIYTALECWRKGCEVRIFERSDSFTIGPSALDSFKNWPWLEKRNSEIAYSPMIARHTNTGERIAGPFDFLTVVASTKPVYRHSRPKFHAMLLEQLAAVGVKVEYGKEVIDYFEDEASGQAGVVLSDGSHHQADVVVAADGVRGRSWKLVAGHEVPARSSGDAIFRVAYPVELALADPIVAERFPLLPDGRSVIELWVGPGMHAAFWRNQDRMEWHINHPDHGTAAESWSNKVTPEDAIKCTMMVPDWPEVANRLIRTTPQDSLVDWKLMWRDPQPKWTSPRGRVIQLGDAAHTFLPSSGNGASQAMEDAVSLAACLALAGEKSEIPDATKVHNLLRFERVSVLQAFGVENRENHRTEAKSVDQKAKWPRLGR